MRAPPSPPTWSRSAERDELRALYAQADALLSGWACACTNDTSTAPRCCQFAVTGREPYPTAVELEEVRHAMRGLAIAPPATRGRKLPLVSTGDCPLLSAEGRCRIYASRPFGCRTFFCHDAEGPTGSRSKLPRDAINAIGRRIADLSARFAPRDPHPRPLVRALHADGANAPLRLLRLPFLRRLPFPRDRETL